MKAEFLTGGISTRLSLTSQPDTSRSGLCKYFEFSAKSPAHQVAEIMPPLSPVSGNTTTGFLNENRAPSPQRHINFKMMHKEHTVDAHRPSPILNSGSHVNKMSLHNLLSSEEPSTHMIPVVNGASIHRTTSERPTRKLDSQAPLQTFARRFGETNGEISRAPGRWTMFQDPAPDSSGSSIQRANGSSPINYSNAQLAGMSTPFDDRTRRIGSYPRSRRNVTSSEPKAKRPWTESEDIALRALVEELGAGLWATMAQQIPGRTGKQVRERWLNHLCPGVTKRPWSPEEDQVILENHSKLGNCWSRIAKMLHGRSDNSVKNRFYTTLRRRIAQPQGNVDSTTAGKRPRATPLDDDAERKRSRAWE